jgi:A/G-specific adenine glycosylase
MRCLSGKHEAMPDPASRQGVSHQRGTDTGLESFAERLIRWQRQHGRKGLPWQHTRDPYRVWLSEIMLQQTQVATVVAYYNRFLQAFPSVLDLANAPEDAVLAQWSGLGYYSRARNLHRCAQIVRDGYAGVFPGSKTALEQLPGIGPSTAAAIAAFCFGERVLIFDANVQRVMSRVFAYGKDMSRSANRRELWLSAERTMPAPDPASTLAGRMSAYTQGLMDLGATVCLPRNPDCGQCPVAALCQAREQGHVQAYPVKTGKMKRTAESWWLLVLIRAPETGAMRVFLHKRPHNGIWGGLHCLPVFPDEAALQTVVEQLPDRGEYQAHPPMMHALTHKDLMLHPVSVMVPDQAAGPQQIEGAWYGQWDALGLPAPVRKWLDAALGASSSGKSDKN